MRLRPNALAFTARVNPEFGRAGAAPPSSWAVIATRGARLWKVGRPGSGRLIRRRAAAGFRVRREGGPARAGGKLGCAVERHS
jgi:hypothetical protein